MIKALISVILIFVGIHLMAQNSSIGEIGPIIGKESIGNIRTYIYKIDPVENATSYDWSEAGFDIMYGQGTREIGVKYNHSENPFNADYVQVVAKNECCVTDTARLLISVYAEEGFCFFEEGVTELSDLDENFESSTSCNSDCGNLPCDIVSKWQNCNWQGSPWVVQSGTTPSFLTGPTDAAEGNNYLYHEAGCNAYSNFRTPDFKVPDNTPYPYTLEFSYHMKGIDVGKLYVYIHDINGNKSEVVWTKSGDQGDFWNRVRIPLARYDGDMIYIDITAVDGPSGGETGDIAIDNIKLVSSGLPIPCDLSMSLSSTATSRFWQADGSATAVVNGIQTNAIYEWSNGARTALIDNLSYGIYNITVTDQFHGDGNCSIEGRVLVPAGGLLGGLLTRLADLFQFKQEQSKLVATLENKIYPNPSSDVVVLDVAEAFLHGQYTVVEIATGKVVNTGVLSSRSSMINMSNSTSGNYAVVLSNDKLVDVLQLSIVK